MNPNHLPKHLNDTQLIAKTDALVKDERKVLLDVLHHLKEIDSRRLYADLKYSSIYQMLTQRYGYSEKEAYSRLSALRLMKELPQVEAKIEKGELNLTHITLMQTLFRQEQRAGHAFEVHDKLKALDAVSNKSTRQTQLLRLELSSNPVELKPDRMTPVSPEKIELTFTANAGLQLKLEQLRGLTAHKQSRFGANQNLGDLFEALVDQAIEAAARPKRRIIAAAAAATVAVEATATATATGVESSGAATASVVTAATTPRCANCSSVHALESDHILPKAKGGADTPDNRRLLCRSCNQRAAIRHFGQAKMESYLG